MNIQMAVSLLITMCHMSTDTKLKEKLSQQWHSAKFIIIIYIFTATYPECIMSFHKYVHNCLSFLIKVEYTVFSHVCVQLQIHRILQKYSPLTSVCTIVAWPANVQCALQLSNGWHPTSEGVAPREVPENRPKMQ